MLICVSSLNSVYFPLSFFMYLEAPMILSSGISLLTPSISAVFFVSIIKPLTPVGDIASLFHFDSWYEIAASNFQSRLFSDAAFLNLLS